MDGAELSCPSWTLWSPDRNFPPANIEWSGGGIEFPYKYTYIHIPMYTYRNTHTITVHVPYLMETKELH